MRRHLTLANLLRVAFTAQLFVLYAWGLWRWTLGTLIISTLLIAIELRLENTRRIDDL
jgi:hypothetical protein